MTSSGLAPASPHPSAVGLQSWMQNSSQDLTRVEQGSRISPSSVGTRLRTRLRGSQGCLSLAEQLSGTHWDSCSVLCRDLDSVILAGPFQLWTSLEFCQSMPAGPSSFLIHPRVQLFNHPISPFVVPLLCILQNSRAVWFCQLILI